VSLFALALESRTAELLHLESAYADLEAERDLYRDMLRVALGNVATLTAQLDYARAQLRKKRTAK
jgi:hypothetical protein